MSDRPAPASASSCAAVEPALRIIIALVAWSEAVAAEDLSGPCRGRREISDARHLAIYLAHVALGLKVEQVAARFGRTPASCRHAFGRVEARRDEAGFDRRVSALEAILEPLRESLRTGDAS